MAIDSASKRSSALSFGDVGLAYPTGEGDEAQRRDGLGYYSGVVWLRVATVAATLPQLTADIASVVTHKATVSPDLPQLTADLSGVVTHVAAVDADLPQIEAAIYGAGVSVGGSDRYGYLGEPSKSAIDRGRL